jgi:Raf kinase inhibitor-like YbhB/YbcL family protein
MHFFGGILILLKFLLIWCILSMSHHENGIHMLTLSCPDFGDNQNIPAKFTCDGPNMNPELHIAGIPEKTLSMTLILDDPDAPRGTWTHWILFNIPPATTVHENSSPGTEGTTDFEETTYGGPCPPSGSHHYYFRLYCLDTKLNLKKGANRKEVENAMKGHIIASATLSGHYRRSE